MLAVLQSGMVAGRQDYRLHSTDEPQRKTMTEGGEVKDKQPDQSATYGLSIRRFIDRTAPVTNWGTHSHLWTVKLPSTPGEVTKPKRSPMEL
jgi:hypothetical protein